ncbi:MAG: hypothetical protein AB7R90_08570 [Reyranellaceae bacterium]
MKSLLWLVLSAPVLAACSTARNDGTTVSKTVEIHVQTMPEGGRCVLERSGEELAVVETTPQTVTVDRGIKNINVTCDLEGHISTVEVLESRYVGGPVNTPYYGGNVAGSLIGSLIVMAIVAGSAANYEYPSAAYVSMQANVFPDAEIRDLKYAELREAIIGRYDARVVSARADCASNAELCRTGQQQAEKIRDAELARLEAFRSKSAIVPPAPEAGEKPVAKKPT